MAPCVERSIERASRYENGDVNASTYIDAANVRRPGCDRSARTAEPTL